MSDIEDDYELEYEDNDASVDSDGDCGRKVDDDDGDDDDECKYSFG